jgi:uncharacterized protein (TIGR03032 family)
MDPAAAAPAETAPKPDAAADAPKPDAPAPLRSVHTTTFAEILANRGISVVVSTYQAGKLVLLRADNGLVNTHFRSFSKPMGVAVDTARGCNRMAIGTAMEVWFFQNVPAVTARLEPATKHDACFLPYTSHTTGDVQIHEMAWSVSPGTGSDAVNRDELWFVNTRFSCLCTLGGPFQFLPRWRPPFITALAPEDRCHLNGLAMRDGAPHIVSALGVTDTAGGWRENKKDGGVLIDIASGEILLRGLSMPHSPRWYEGRLWLLESGTGSIGVVDLKAGRYEPIAQVPGFTRGLDFYGRFAFIGLSQVRETAVFSGIPLTERLKERTCGVWVIDWMTGQTVAFLRFEDAVQEIFAVQVLPNFRFPDLINDDIKLIADSFVLPDEALKQVSDSYRKSDKPAAAT